jgi:hypothetical protein
MSFHADNTAFETWLRCQCAVIEPDLDYKHERMKKSPFAFLRATFFRWAKRIARVCPDLRDAPSVLCVGDTHTENFGTWRDAEGRLVWGVNDFDEAAVMPYVFDLVRLAASVRLAPHVMIGGREAADALLEGYRTGLLEPRPTLLDQQETWMRPYVACSDDDREKFWDELHAHPDAEPPGTVANILTRNLPPDAHPIRFASRRKGGGGLGRPRYLAVAGWRGGTIVREAKALVPSTWDWAHCEAAPPQFLKLANGKFRAPDPFLDLKEKFLLRRIASDSRKIDLGDDAGAKLKTNLLRAMGFDLGAIHAATDGAPVRIQHDLGMRKADWLHSAAKAAAADVERDFEEWAG